MSEPSTASKAYPIPVLFDLRMEQRLRKTARMLGISNSALVRLSVMLQLKEIEEGTIRVAPLQQMQAS